MTPAEIKLLREAIEIIQVEHDQMVRSFTVRAKASPDYGRVTDRAAARDISRMAGWLEQARQVAK